MTRIDTTSFATAALAQRTGPVFTNREPPPKINDASSIINYINGLAREFQSDVVTSSDRVHGSVIKKAFSRVSKCVSEISAGRSSAGSDRESVLCSLDTFISALDYLVIETDELILMHDRYPKAQLDALKAAIDSLGEAKFKRSVVFEPKRALPEAADSLSLRSRYINIAVELQRIFGTTGNRTSDEIKDSILALAQEIGQREDIERRVEEISRSEMTELFIIAMDILKTKSKLKKNRPASGQLELFKK